MNDSRIELQEKFILNNREKCYKIADEVGRGANCIVYNASFLDSAGIMHLARIKELYPVYLPINRDADRILHCDINYMDKFEEAKERFKKAYETNVKFRNTYGVMNSTINPSDLFETNGTVYTVMTLDEGEDYRSYKDGSLTEMLTHLKALASVISRCHEERYLYLDIKPENTFVIPETSEHVYLFDFDSVCKIDDLQTKKNMDVSYSDGFSAPEQVQGIISKVGTHTDIYAIGAVLFYKLFNRKPSFDDGCYLARYDFSLMNFYDKTIRPSFYRKLEAFFHKTLATSIILRWKDIHDVIDALNELIGLSNTEDNYLIDSFAYNSACFVGRTKELEEMHDILQCSNVLFLSGIGGIGKTELAKKYVAEYRNEYDSVAFVFYNESIEHSICRELKIHNLQQDKEESERDYFGRVIEALQRFSTSKDLIIIDNFDVERDPRLEELLLCPCKFLITTRNTNIRDWNYEEIKIDRMDMIDDLVDLFKTYNSEDYNEYENEVVRKLINFVDGHTMTVELISKYLRCSEQLPSDLYEAFLEQSGITNTNDQLTVNQRKDFRMNSESVNQHLSLLFDVFSFDVIAKEIISSLSLFAGIRIRRNRFENLCNIKGIHEEIDLLIDKGWVEFNTETEKISLHQVIQDLIFAKLGPTSMNCPNITAGMLAYKKEEVENYTEQRIRSEVFNVFAGRLSGTDTLYAKICYEYGDNKKISEAIEICEGIDTKESYELLKNLYMKEIQRLIQAEDYIYTEESGEEYGNRIYGEICAFLRKTIEVCKKYSDDKTEQILLLADIGPSLDKWLGGVGIAIYVNAPKGLAEVINIMDDIFEIIGDNIMYTSLQEEKKIDILTTLRDFYSEEEFNLSSYLGEGHKDIEKAYLFQKNIDYLREEIDRADDECYVDAYKVDTSTRAQNMCEDGHHADAIKLYLKEYENGSVAYDDAFGNVADIFLQIGDYENAVKYYELIFKYDRKRIADGQKYAYYSHFYCVKLLKILYEKKMHERLKHYSQELIDNMEKEIDSEDISQWGVSSVLIAYFYLYLLSEDHNQRNKYWNRCKALFDMLDSNELDEELSDFAFEYIKKEQLNEIQVIDIVNRFSIWNIHCEVKERLINRIIGCFQGEETFSRCHILLLLHLAMITNEYPFERISEGLKYCGEAESIANSLEYIEPYYLNKILQVKSNIMSNDEGVERDQVMNEKQKCNHFIIASFEASGKSEEKQIEIWKDTASECHYADKYEEELKCLEQALNIIMPIMDQYDFSGFNTQVWYIMRDMINAYAELNRTDEACSLLGDLYKLVINHYYMNKDDEDRQRETYDKIMNIAWDYMHVGSQINAFRGYLMALYFILIKRKNKKVLMGYFRNVEDIFAICDRMKEKLEGLSPKAVDNIMEIKEDMDRLTINEEYVAPVVSILEEVERRYRNKEVEFKPTN